MILNFSLHIVIFLCIFLAITLFVPRLIAIELHKVKVAKNIFGIIYAILFITLFFIIVCFNYEMEENYINLWFLTNNLWFSVDNFVLFESFSAILIYFGFGLPLGFFIAIFTNKKIISKTLIFSCVIAVLGLFLIIAFPINKNICLVNLLSLVLGGFLSGYLANTLYKLHFSK